jgi:dihydroorotase
MIDSHVHLRDWDWGHKETLEHGLYVAGNVGLAAVFDMPNTSPAITTRELVEKRLSEAESLGSDVFYGLYVGVTPDVEQVKRTVEIYREFFPKLGDRVGVIGLKMFAGKSVGDLSVSGEEEQFRVYETLAIEGYEGVIAVHCEKESLIKPELWDPRNPVTHNYARTPESEVESVNDQINFAGVAGFATREGTGHLHICHVSVPNSLYLIEEARRAGMSISCEVTPHHCLLDTDCMNLGHPHYHKWEDAILKKVNPPLRSPEMREKILEALIEGRVDFTASDHAPHTYDEKIGKAFDAKGNPQYMSGFPGLPFLPNFINFLRTRKMGEGRIGELTHNNIERIFGLEHLELPVRDVSPDLNLHTEYEVDVYRGVRERLT